MIRPPTKSVVDSFPDKAICHLLMWNTTDHVAYIPDIEVFLDQIFNYPKAAGDSSFVRSYRRCGYCMGLLADRNALVSHLKSGVCYLNMPRPSVVVLPKAGTYLPTEDLSKVESPVLTVVVDSESRLLSPQHGGSNEFSAIFGSVDPSSKGLIDAHVPQSIGLCFLDENFKLLEYKAIVSDDILYTFEDILSDGIKKHMELCNARKCFTPVLTKDEEELHATKTHCERCKRPFDPSKKSTRRVKHHNHTIWPKFANDGFTIQSGNYIGALCNQCNLSITSKRLAATVVMHNMSYDMSMFLKGLVSRKENIKKVRVVCKGAFKYYNIRYRNMNFIDSYLFMSSSLADLVHLRCKDISDSRDLYDVIPLTAEVISQKYGSHMMEFVNRKQVFPYSLCKSKQELENWTTYPSKLDFYNTLTQENVTDHDWLFGQRVWHALEQICEANNTQMSLLVMHHWYLCLDVMLLSDVWKWYCETIYKDFGVHPSNYLSGNALAWSIARRMAEKPLELLSNYQLYIDLEGGIKGGFVTVTQRYAKANNIELPDYDPSKPDKHLYMLDWNGMYSEIMCQNLPYGNLEYVDPTTFTPEYIASIDTSENAVTGYFFIVDLRIPNHLKYLYDDFPLTLVMTEKIKASPHTTSISTHLSQKKLIASWYDIDEYCVDIQLLQFYLVLGVSVSKIHRVISYSQAPIFKRFIEHCTDKRLFYKNVPVLNSLYKLLCNSVFGKSIQNDRTYDKTHTLVHRDNLNYHVSSPRFLKIRQVSDDCFCVTKNKPVVKLSSPIYIGALILMRSKLKNQKYHYFIAKVSASDFPSRYIIPVKDEKIMRVIAFSRQHIKSVRLVYSDTDSLTYFLVMHTKGLTMDFIFRHLFISLFLDRSNFKVLSTAVGQDGNSASSQNSLGLYKSELCDDLVEEGIFLSPKTYSIKTIPRQKATKQHQQQQQHHGYESYKVALKGVPKRYHKNVFTHEIFRNVLMAIHDGHRTKVTYNHFRFDPKLATMTTRSVTKQPLSLADNKRYYLDTNTSYAWGHPNTSEQIGDVICLKGGIIAGTTHMINPRLLEMAKDLTYGRSTELPYLVEEEDTGETDLDLLIDLLEEDEGLAPPFKKMRKCYPKIGSGESIMSKAQQRLFLVSNQTSDELIVEG